MEDHLDRGELDFAIALAKVVTSERGRPLDLDLSLRFLPLIASQRPRDFDRWTLRWLERWCSQLRDRATIDDAAELVGGLAEIPVDPEQGLISIKSVSDRHEGPGPRL